ncbi:glycerophosphodiester phosphodiesterase [Desulfovibrio ferrophilus]|uniref:Glycerophosphodiester phosphodiesterase n=1 Tax=Desulfovibrio ferrophilus TaxID=241368 RepID=A0A2Z6AYS5_9BACT|nr:glycerophosphodiester phosphodiesterase family protein [Desulfovibrio ferrophilus]BBD08306.1 glycerophosphodiester phosphodiesterase [Desulfovibrio ferrophilus]
MPTFDLDHSLCWAHRGFSAKYPENTLAAFEAALEAGADGIELDVTLSRDGRLVVIHDETLDRTTDGTGPVSALDWDELGDLDAGRWFDEAFAGQRLPSLSEVLDVVGGKMLVNIEIKPEAACVSADVPVEQQVLDCVREHGLMDSVVVSSFDYSILLRLRGLDADLRLGTLFTGEEENIDFRALLQAIDAFSFHIRAAELIPEIVDLFHEDGIKVYCWTESYDDEALAMEQVLEMGVDGFFANNVEYFLAKRA